MANPPGNSGVEWVKDYLRNCANAVAQEEAQKSFLGWHRLWRALFGEPEQYRLFRSSLRRKLWW